MPHGPGPPVFQGIRWDAPVMSSARDGAQRLAGGHHAPYAARTRASGWRAHIHRPGRGLQANEHIEIERRMSRNAIFGVAARGVARDQGPGQRAGHRRRRPGRGRSRSAAAWCRSRCSPTARTRATMEPVRKAAEALLARQPGVINAAAVLTAHKPLQAAAPAAAPAAAQRGHRRRPSAWRPQPWGTGRKPRCCCPR